MDYKYKIGTEFDFTNCEFVRSYYKSAKLIGYNGIYYILDVLTTSGNRVTNDNSWEDRHLDKAVATFPLEAFVKNKLSSMGIKING